LAAIAMGFLIGQASADGLAPSNSQIELQRCGAAQQGASRDEDCVRISGYVAAGVDDAAGDARGSPPTLFGPSHAEEPASRGDRDPFFLHASHDDIAR
jgi:hypothetical protein